MVVIIAVYGILTVGKSRQQNKNMGKRVKLLEQKLIYYIKNIGNMSIIPQQ